MRWIAFIDSGEDESVRSLLAQAAGRPDVSTVFNDLERSMMGDEIAPAWARFGGGDLKDKEERKVFAEEVVRPLLIDRVCTPATPAGLIRFDDRTLPRLVAKEFQGVLTKSRARSFAYSGSSKLICFSQTESARISGLLRGKRSRFTDVSIVRDFFQVDCVFSARMRDRM